eukprot:Rmarinus@m.29047
MKISLNHHRHRNCFVELCCWLDSIRTKPLMHLWTAPCNFAAHLLLFRAVCLPTNILIGDYPVEVWFLASRILSRTYSQNILVLEKLFSLWWARISSCIGDLSGIRKKTRVQF